MQPDIQSQINRILDLLQRPLHQRLDFWIFFVLAVIGIAAGVASLYYAVLAYEEAKLAKSAAEQAKKAATEAGKTVRVQTVAIELGEITQKLEQLRPDILFSEARDLFNEVSRRLRRAISPFADDPALKTTIAAVRAALDATQTSLKNVRPTDPNKERETPAAVYNGVEADFVAISNLVADLLGLFEQKTFHFGDTNG